MDALVPNLQGGGDAERAGNISAAPAMPDPPLRIFEDMSMLTS